MILDASAPRKVSAREIPSIVDYSPYEEYEFPAWPDTVICGGKIVVKDAKNV